MKSIVIGVVALLAAAWLLVSSVMLGMQIYHGAGGGTAASTLGLLGLALASGIGGVIVLIKGLD